MEQTEKDKQELLRLLEEKQRRRKYNKIMTCFPDEGPYKRALYPKHTTFMAKGLTYKLRAFIAANRVGKTFSGAYELSCHLTGQYPDWWVGHKFTDPIRAWCAGVTVQATRDVMQFELLGPNTDQGSGMIPKDCLVKIVNKQGVASAVETIIVKHVSGGYSELTFKTYEQGRESFQGTKMDFIWLDEEPSDYGIVTECLTRTMSGPGEHRMMVITFTPLLGLTELIEMFMPGGVQSPGGINPDNPYVFCTSVTWDDVPHLSESDKEQLKAQFKKHELAARTQGIPTLGSGKIYSVDEYTSVIPAFKIPEWWPKFYGLDVGWNMTAAVWVAIDPNSGKKYVYREYYQGEGVPAIHAAAIKAVDPWIVGAIDPASEGKSQVDGSRLLDHYTREGLTLVTADNSVEAGIQLIQQEFASNMLMIFDTCQNVITEMRVYRRDDKGHVVKKRDHAMDALRYAMVTGIHYAMTAQDYYNQQDEGGSRMGGDRNEITGY